MRVSLISFTKNGAALCARLAAGLAERGHSCEAFAMPRHAGAAGLLPLETAVGAWAGEHFAQSDALVFVAACGIAVRAVAPYIRDKSTDPAVVAVDESGAFAVPLLSGHVGGANALALLVAGLCGAQAAVTTATDRNGLFAVDSWAAENNLYLCDKAAAKRVSAALLEGAFVGFQSDFPVEGELPRGVTAAQSGALGIYITLDETKQPFLCTLRLVPRVLTAGVGCRRGAPKNAIEERVLAALAEQNLSPHGLKQVCSIALKAGEAGLLAFCAACRLPFSTYTAEELAAVAGQFTPSEFVRGVTGVENVCERAAVLGSGGGELLVKKCGANGVTAAIAREDWRIRF